MESSLPRLTSISGVARALMATVGTEDAVDILVAQFGWDVAFLAMARIENPEAGVALYKALHRHLCDDLTM